MGPVNVKEARRRLSALLDAAEQGETIPITRRGKSVAQIAPAKRRSPRRFPDLTEFRRSIRLKGKPMSETVIEMRRAERA